FSKGAFFSSISHSGERKQKSSPGKKLRKAPLTAEKTGAPRQHPLRLFFYFIYKGRLLIATILQGEFLLEPPWRSLTA
ncbi:hypothetical protein, partial [Candidatus Cardinium hertigii]|uniref:hypothetical protein n=1 Tax=Candidatus Cardinium hertigii TaxID=247481 RepID=UPI001FAA8274